MLQAANTDLFKPLVPKAQSTEWVSKSIISFTNYVSHKSQFKLLCGLLFFAPPAPALMG